MSRYEARLQRDTQRIRDGVTDLGSLLEEAVEASVRALLDRDRTLAYNTILRDQVVNRRVKAVDEMCHAFVARHQPSAGHLRFVSSVLRINIALERVGDYAVTICREAARLSDRPWGTLRRDVDLLLLEARKSLRLALEAFVSQNADLARGTRAMASTLGRSFDQIFNELAEEGRKGTRPLSDLFALLIVVNRLSRVCDQAKNICEEAVFVATGEMKRAKKFKILFLDAANDRWSQMARALGERLYEGRARFASAGWDPAPHLDADFVTFLERQGYDLAGIQPSRVDPNASFLRNFDILVSLQGDPRPHLPEIPYHCVVQIWRIDDGLTSLAEGYRRVTARLSGLMEILCGEAAA